MSQQQWISSSDGLHIAGCNQAITRSGSYWLLILHTVNTSKHQFHHCKDAICLNEASSQPVKPSWHSCEAQNAANPLLDSHINISQWLHRIPITLVNTAQPAYFINSTAESAGQSYHRSIVLLCYIIKMSTGHQSGEKTHKSTRCPQRIHPTLKYCCSAIVNIFFLLLPRHSKPSLFPSPSPHVAVNKLCGPPRSPPTYLYCCVPFLSPLPTQLLLLMLLVDAQMIHQTILNHLTCTVKDRED